MKRILPIIFFALSCTEVLFAATVTDYRRPRYGQPLSNNNITALARDPLGFLWVASRGELARFDGLSYHPLDGMSGTELFEGGNIVQSMEFPCWMSAAAGSRSPRRWPASGFIPSCVPPESG